MWVPELGEDFVYVVFVHAESIQVELGAELTDECAVGDIRVRSLSLVAIDAVGIELIVCHKANKLVSKGLALNLLHTSERNIRLNHCCWCVRVGSRWSGRWSRCVSLARLRPRGLCLCIVSLSRGRLTHLHLYHWRLVLLGLGLWMLPSFLYDHARGVLGLLMRGLVQINFKISKLFRVLRVIQSFIHLDMIY